MPTNPILGDGGIHHMALRVSDFDRSITFYTTVLGFTERIRWNESPNRIALLDTGNRSYLELFEAKGDAPKIESAFWHLAFRVADAGACLEHARKAGCPVHVETKTVPNIGNSGIDIRVAFCKGPDGELIEFFQCDEL